MCGFRHPQRGLGMYPLLIRGDYFIILCNMLYFWAAPFEVISQLISLPRVLWYLIQLADATSATLLQHLQGKL